MDLSTTYLGLKLKNPIVASASPLSRTLDSAKRLEDAGAAAIVMYSLFEEQINHERQALDHFLTLGTDTYAEALSYFPEPEEYNNLHAEEYLEHLSQLKKALNIPIIGSLNGVSRGGWISYAKKMEEAGADAIELNIYYIAADPRLTSQDVEQMYLLDVEAVKEATSLPVALKIGPYFSSFANMASRFDQSGVNGLVLFNRFFGPDIDLDTLEVVPRLSLSSPQEIRLPLRWIAMLYGKLKCSLAATSGVHHPLDVIKLVMAGADVTMVASALLHHGEGYVRTMLQEIQHWMEEQEYSSIAQMKGSMSAKSIAEPVAYERANYMKALQSYR